MCAKPPKPPRPVIPPKVEPPKLELGEDATEDPRRRKRRGRSQLRTGLTIAGSGSGLAIQE